MKCQKMSLWVFQKRSRADKQKGVCVKRSNLAVKNAQKQRLATAILLSKTIINLQNFLIAKFIKFEDLIRFARND